MTMIKSPASPLRPRRVAFWLFLCAFMVFSMAVIGATTRLTESGLSITEWKPVMGTLPPLDAQDWALEFSLYQKTPEYRHKNIGMTLDEFKTIYFWEWIHRLWGRLIGVVFFVPFLVFWLNARIPHRYNWPLFGLFLLGGAQGFVGWFMVQSGLIDRPSVSHYRLALHLFLALLLFALLIWTALSVWLSGKKGHFDTSESRTSRYLKLHGLMALILIMLTVIYGAFVAGLDAGLIYNEFPTMGEGRLIPSDMWPITPAWLNLFENHASVQFMHRWLAIITTLVLLSFVTHGMLSGQKSWIFPVLAVMCLLQAGLGVLTLLSGVHIMAAVIHQAGAIVLLGLLTTALHSVFHTPRDNRSR